MIMDNQKYTDEQIIEALEHCEKDNFDECKKCPLQPECHKGNYTLMYTETLDMIRKYRKQSENVIELPCKVGTTLYFIYNSPYADKPDLTPRIYKTADWYFEVDKTGIVINTSDIHSFNKEYDYHLGKTVFLTQKEAKQALAKMKGGAE